LTDFSERKISPHMGVLLSRAMEQVVSYPQICSGELYCTFKLQLRLSTSDRQYALRDVKNVSDA